MGRGTSRKGDKSPVLMEPIFQRGGGTEQTVCGIADTESHTGKNAEKEMSVKGRVREWQF